MARVNLTYRMRKPCYRNYEWVDFGIAIKINILVADHFLRLDYNNTFILLRCFRVVQWAILAKSKSSAVPSL
jgi:hypothetical protein